MELGVDRTVYKPMPTSRCCSQESLPLVVWIKFGVIRPHRLKDHNVLVFKIVSKFE